MQPTPLHPFATLTPDVILDAVESLGMRSDCRVFALNSYENRVFQVGLEDAPPLIAKFYRPERWNDAQIREEHAFCFELADLDIPVVAPMRIDGESLFAHKAFRFALYPRKGGHAPELDNLDNLLTLGRMMGRIHAAGAVRAYQHRPALTLRTFGEESVAFVRDQFIPPHRREVYASICADLLTAMTAVEQRLGPVRPVRTHGDCHSGNILWRDDAPHFVDFDDSRMAPAIQDLWMMLSGDRPRQLTQLAELIEGYDEFYRFDPRELPLIEVLRTLRILHYTAWLARRWQDPAFPACFPWFNTERGWDEHILQLREQLSALQDPPLALF